MSFEQHASLYDALPNSYSLLITTTTSALDQPAIAQMRAVFAARNIPFNIVSLNSAAVKKYYPRNYYLLRPDWHIAWHDDTLPLALEVWLHQMMPA